MFVVRCCSCVVYGLLRVMCCSLFGSFVVCCLLIAGLASVVWWLFVCLFLVFRVCCLWYVVCYVFCVVLGIGVLFGVCCLLSCGLCLLFVACCLLVVGWCLLFGSPYSLLFLFVIVRCVSFVVMLSFAVCWLLFVVWSMSLVGCCLLFGVVVIIRYFWFVVVGCCRVFAVC